MPRRAKTIEPGVSAYQTAKGARWRWVADAGHINGKRIQRRRQGYRSERAAQDARRAFLREVERGSLVDAGRRTLADYLTNDWLPHYQRVRPRSYVTRVANLRHAIAVIGQIRLDRLKPLDIQRLYAALQESGYAPNTIQSVHGALSGALRQAVKWRLIATNPAIDTERPAAPDTPIAVYTPAQVAHLIASETDTRYQALWALAATTGMRRGELLWLRWEDVDLARGVVHVQRGGAHDQTKSEAGRRTLLLSPAMVELIRSHQRCQEHRRLTAGELWQNDGHLFDGGHGQQLAISSYNRAWRRAVARAGLPYSKPHSLRHTNATLAMAANIHPKIVQQRLGHSSIEMTMRYSHVATAMQEEMAALMGAVALGEPTAETSEPTTA